MTVTTDRPLDAAAEARRDALVGRLFAAVLGSLELQAVYLGDRLGLYRALADGGPATAPELAARAGIDAALRPRVAGAAGGRRDPRGRRRRAPRPTPAATRCRPATKRSSSIPRAWR